MMPEEKERKAFIDKEYKRIMKEDAAKRKAAYEKKKKANQPRKSKYKGSKVINGVKTNVHNAEANAKAVKRYNDAVWPGWRTKDDKRHRVKTYTIEELRQQEQAEAAKKKGAASTPKKKPREK